MHSSKKNKSPSWWLQNIRFNVQRLSRLMLRGKFNKIFFPDKYEGKNNFQRITLFGNSVVNSVLKQTVNASVSDIANVAKNLPKEFANRLICFKPTLIRFIRTRQAKANQERFMNVINQEGKLKFLDISLQK